MKVVAQRVQGKIVLLDKPIIKPANSSWNGEIRCISDRYEELIGTLIPVWLDVTEEMVKILREQADQTTANAI